MNTLYGRIAELEAENEHLRRSICGRDKMDFIGYIQLLLDMYASGEHGWRGMRFYDFFQQWEEPGSALLQPYFRPDEAELRAATPSSAGLSVCPSRSSSRPSTASSSGPAVPIRCVFYDPVTGRKSITPPFSPMRNPPSAAILSDVQEYTPPVQPKNTPVLKGDAGRW
jgi:hypothetical protein